MRITPMTVSEQSDIESRMLEHFGLAQMVTTGTRRTWRIKDVKRSTEAVQLSQAFFALSNPDDIDSPICAEEMILAIRYKLGYGWWAWFFFKNFAIPIIKWLWNEYHKPQPTGKFSTT